MAPLTDPLHLSILCPGGNFLSIGSLLANGLEAFDRDLPPGSTVAAVTGLPRAQLAMQGPQLVADGAYDVAITTPAWHLRMALEGRGPFERPLPVRTLATFAHDDQLALAIRATSDVADLRDLATRQLPLRVSMPTRDHGHPAGWVLDRIFGLVGFTQDDLVGWGGAVLDDRPASMNAPGAEPVDPSFDAVFDEAVMTRRWQQIAESYDLRFLGLDDALLDGCRELGMDVGTLRSGRIRGVDRDIPTVDFSGWVLYCSDALPAEVASLIVRALDDKRELINGRFTGPNAAMTSPISMDDVGRDPAVPLHEGAEQYYRDQGYL